ncbi:hypothetical protein FZX02_04075 [Synechococcus sp. MU1644]|nr:hypothetical protein [Synechococcus sp. MU1644]
MPIRFASTPELLTAETPRVFAAPDPSDCNAIAGLAAYRETMREKLTYGRGDELFGKVSHAAKRFMIAFAFGLPPVLVWTYLL